MDSGSGEDTSSYWRKVLKLDAPSPDITKHCDNHLKLLRPVLRTFVAGLFDRVFDLESFGRENLPEKAPFMIASNHVSSLDFPAVFLSLPENHKDKICVIYKKLYDLLPFTRMFIKSFVPSFSVDSRGDFLSAMATAAAALKSGRILYIAPEGTRSSGELLPFKMGVGALAIETGTCVVPVYIRGSEKALPRGSIFPKKHRVKVYFEKPVRPNAYIDMKRSRPAYEVYKEFTNKVRDSISDMINNSAVQP